MIKSELYHDLHVTFVLFDAENFITDYSLMSVDGLFSKRDCFQDEKVSVVIGLLNHIHHLFRHMCTCISVDISIKSVDASGQKVGFLRNLKLETEHCSM